MNVTLAFNTSNTLRLAAPINFTFAKFLTDLRMISDGSERIIPELLGGGLVRMAKKAGKLTSHVNKLLKFEDDLYTPAKRNEIIQTYAKTNNPFTGLKLKKGEDALKDIDLDLIPYIKMYKKL